jgi:hypothetical protein
VTTIDPMFANPATNDYRLKSAAGRWADGTGGWVMDTVTSPAIDRGSPTADYAAEPSPNGGRINLGYDGNTPRTSRSR